MHHDDIDFFGSPTFSTCLIAVTNIRSLAIVKITNGPDWKKPTETVIIQIKLKKIAL